MIPYPNINPEIVSFGPYDIAGHSIGPIAIKWYGLMYVLGFIMSYFLIQKQERSRQMGLVGTVAQDLIFYLAVGLIVGGRLGYILFYEYNSFDGYFRHPLEIIATWHGGMSFHGGLIGCILVGWIFCRRRKFPFFAVGDSVIVTVPVGLGLGRLGNFINGELFGLPSDLPWAMIFPQGGPVPRHPTQLYESLAEGLLLFLILWNLRKRHFRDGMMIVFFLAFYGVFRFVIEIFKEPDPQLGYLLGGHLTMGQVLCAGMILAAGALALYLRRLPQKPAAKAKAKRSK